MSDAEPTGDELRGRMRGLARGAEQTPAPGLGDVRRRRARRQRNASVATAAGVVAVVGATALILQPFGGDPSVRPLGPGPASSRSTEGSSSSSSAPPASTSVQTSTSTSTTSPSTSTSTSSPTDTSTPPVEPADPILALDLGSLVLPDELTAVGISLQSDQLGDADGQPTLPPMCTASSWQEQYSGPDDRVSGGYVIEDGQLGFDLLAYPSASEANAALVKLKEDARACPVVNEFLAVTVTAVGVAVGDEFVVFVLDSESGEDGSVERIWVTIARVDNVLVSATVDRDQGFAGDVSGDEQLSRTAAQANVDHLLAA